MRVAIAMYQEVEDGQDETLAKPHDSCLYKHCTHSQASFHTTWMVKNQMLLILAFPVEGKSLGRSFSQLFGRSVLFIGLGNFAHKI